MGEPARMKWRRLQAGMYAADGPDGAEYIVERVDGEWRPRSGSSWAPHSFQLLRWAKAYVEECLAGCRNDA